MGIAHPDESRAGPCVTKSSRVAAGPLVRPRFTLYYVVLYFASERMPSITRMYYVLCPWMRRAGRR